MNSITTNLCVVMLIIERNEKTKKPLDSLTRNLYTVYADMRRMDRIGDGCVSRIAWNQAGRNGIGEHPSFRWMWNINLMTDNIYEKFFNNARIERLVK
jgi:hypothetical protein